jgi:hypothetical protein
MNSKVGMLYSDITFGHINKFPLFDLEPYEQTKLNNKLTVIVPIEKMLTFQSKLFIPKSR